MNTGNIKLYCTIQEDHGLQVFSIFLICWFGSINLLLIYLLALGRAYIFRVFLRDDIFTQIYITTLKLAT